MAAIKTIDDLPHFRVSAVNQNESHEPYYELTGVLDRTTDVPEGLCSLLLPDKEVLTAMPGYLQFRNAAANEASVQITGQSVPDIVGLTLAYVHPKWNPVQVWMVSVPTWKWTSALFQATDATTKIVKGTHVSILDGEEIKEWIELKEKGKDTGLSRRYPVFPSGKSTLLQIDPDGTVKGGWNHAHCQLCDTHIEAGNQGYVDPGGHWVCEGCYSRFVESHDLSFMFV